MKIKYSSLFVGTYALYFLIRLLFYLNEFKSGLYIPVTFLFLEIEILIFVKMNKSHLLFSHNQKIMIYGISLWLIWAVLSSFFGIDSGKSFSFMESFVPFIIFVLLTPAIISNYELQDKFLKVSIVILGTFLICQYFRNYNGLDVFGELNHLFAHVRTERYRQSYGLYHPNATGNLCLCYLILLCFEHENGRNKKSNIFFLLYKIVSAVIVAVMLLSTASRSSITGLILFLLVCLYSSISNKGGLIWKFLLAVIVIVSVMMIVWSLDFNSLVELSNRMINYTVNIPLLINKGRMAVGFGILPSGYFGVGDGLSALGSSYVDSYYLYILMTTGLIGCVILFVPLCIFFFSIIRQKQKDRIQGNMLKCGLLIVMLYTGFFETCILYSTFISSLVYWTILLSSKGTQVGEIASDYNK